MEKLPKHLGGHMNVTHTDEAVLQFFKDNYDVKSMLDVGCGPGGMSEIAKKMGISWKGVDGDFTLKQSDIEIFDFTSGPYKSDQKFDLGWSVEFLEHVDEQYVQNFMEAFKLCKRVVLTHALPNKFGYHHVNCQRPNYWIDIFDQNGFKINPEDSLRIREISSMKREFMRSTGLIFENSECNKHNCYFPVGQIHEWDYL